MQPKNIFFLTENMNKTRMLEVGAYLTFKKCKYLKCPEIVSKVR